MLSDQKKNLELQYTLYCIQQDNLSASQLQNHGIVKGGKDLLRLLCPTTNPPWCWRFCCSLGRQHPSASAPGQVSWSQRSGWAGRTCPNTGWAWCPASPAIPLEMTSPWSSSAPTSPWQVCVPHFWQTWKDKRTKVWNRPLVTCRRCSPKWQPVLWGYSTSRYSFLQDRFIPESWVSLAPFDESFQ